MSPLIARKSPTTADDAGSSSRHAVGSPPLLQGLPEVLKVPEVAEVLRVDRKTVYDLIDRGELGAIRVGRRGLVRVSKAMLASYLEGRVALTGGIHAGTT